MEFDAYVADKGTALLRFARVITGDPYLAEDLVQATLAKAFRRWRRIGEMEHPDAYVRRIVVTKHLDWRRRMSNSEAPSAVDVLDRAADDHAPAVAARDEMRQLLVTLPKRQRTVLALRYYADYDDAAIAATLGCGESTVRSNAARALATLRSAFSPQPDQEPAQTGQRVPRDSRETDDD